MQTSEAIAYKAAVPFRDREPPCGTVRLLPHGTVFRRWGLALRGPYRRPRHVRRCMVARRSRILKGRPHGRIVRPGRRASCLSPSGADQRAAGSGECVLVRLPVGSAGEMGPGGMTAAAVVDESNSPSTAEDRCAQWKGAERWQSNFIYGIISIHRDRRGRLSALVSIEVRAACRRPPRRRAR